MIPGKEDRRFFLFGLAGLGMSQALFDGLSLAQTGMTKGYVLGAGEGEHLIHFRDHGNIFIKVGSGAGSDKFSIGTQQVTLGTGVPIHRHPRMEEAFYVLEGSGTFILNDARLPFDQGGFIFIPTNSWHGFENPNHELLLLWVTSPPGLDGFFRETCTPPGVAPKQLTREQINALALKHGIEFR